MAAKKKTAPMVTARDLQLIRIVGAAAVVILFLYFVIMPGITNHEALETENKALQAEVAKCSSAAPTLQLETQAETNYSIIKTTLAGYPTTLGSTELDQLTTVIASDNGVGIYSLSMVNPATYAALPVYTPASADGTSGTQSSTSKQSGTEATMTGIYGATINVTFYGEDGSLQQVIDSICSGAYPNVHLVSFSKSSPTIATQASGENLLTMQLTVYSYVDKSTPAT